MGEKKKSKEFGEQLPVQETAAEEVVTQLGEKAFSLHDLAVAQYGMNRPLSHIEDGLNEAIVGQSPAIESLVTSLYRENLRNPNRPLAVLMFLGPTGVGKSETAKVLDNLLHGNRDTLLKIDCSNYGENHRVSALIGAAPEYVGREQKPILDKNKIEQPRSIVLFDEIEKGASKLFDLLLQIMEDGEVTLLNGGQKVSFRNSIIILTSNVGADEMRRLLNPNSLGFNQGKNKEATRKELEAVAHNALKTSGKFKPEFLNRIDEKIIFEQLNDAQIGEVLDIHVRNANKFYEKQGIYLTLTPELRDELVASTPERKEFGARPVLAKYRKLIEGLMAKMYTTGGIPTGSDVYAMLDSEMPNETPIDQKIQLRYGPQRNRSTSVVKYQEKAGKHRKAEANEETDTASHDKIKNQMTIYALAAAGVASLFVTDYLSSRRSRRAY